MGTGKVALQLFLQRSHHVFGIELAPSRWRLAMEALASLAAARPKRFRYEVQLGSFRYGVKVEVCFFTWIVFSLQDSIKWSYSDGKIGRGDSFLFGSGVSIMLKFLHCRKLLYCKLLHVQTAAILSNSFPSLDLSKAETQNVGNVFFF